MHPFQCPCPAAKERAAAKERNPRAFVASSRGAAKKVRMRNAEKEQRRMHGEVQ